jgi:hypothetical protein
MRAVVAMVPNDEATLPSAAHAVRTIEGVESVIVDEARNALVVDYDADTIDDGELLTRVASEGIQGVELVSLDES